MPSPPPLAAAAAGVCCVCVSVCGVQGSLLPGLVVLGLGRFYVQPARAEDAPAAVVPGSCGVEAFVDKYGTDWPQPTWLAPTQANVDLANTLIDKYVSIHYDLRCFVV